VNQDQQGEFYTLEEVEHLLNLSQASVYRKARDGELPYVLPKHRKIGMLFPKGAIDVLARRQRREKAQQRVSHLSFVSSTTADLWVAVENARQLYGDEDIISFERALEWRDINPEISMSVKAGKYLAGMVTMLPLDEQIILALLRDDLREKDIPDQAIRPWADSALSVYIAGIAVVPTGDALMDRLRGRFLLYHSIKWAMLLAAQYDIKNWYSIGVTQEGKNLCQQLGFREVVSLKDGLRKGYVLDDILRNPSRLIQRMLKRMERTSTD
jgi:predicted DNA-binding transcriptional regulator AlpA